jgi:hypothetical protein
LPHQAEQTTAKDARADQQGVSTASLFRHTHLLSEKRQG